MLGEIHRLNGHTIHMRGGILYAGTLSRTIPVMRRLVAMFCHKIVLTTIITGFVAGQLVVPRASAPGGHAVSLYRNRVVALEFHDVSATNKSVWTLTPQGFDQIVTRLQGAGFVFVSPAQVTGFLAHKENVPSNALLMTFDDGLMDVYTHAFPILLKHRIPFLFTVIGNRVGRGPLYLSLVEIHAMLQSGIATIGAHSWGLHSSIKTAGRLVPRMLAVLPWETNATRSDRLFRDGEAIQREITVMTGKSTPWYAWPFGAYDQTAVQAMRLAGFRYFLTSSAGSVRRSTNALRIPRIDVGEHKLSYRTILTKIADAACSNAQPPVRSGVSSRRSQLAYLRREYLRDGDRTIMP